MKKYNENKEDLLSKIGLNSIHRVLYKKLDGGLLGGSKQSDALSRHGYALAEKYFNDSQIYACFMLSIMPVMLTELKFKPISEGDQSNIEKSIEISDFLNYSLRKLKNGGSKQMLFDLLTCKYYGWSLLEKIYTIEFGGAYDGFYCYESVNSKRQGLWDFEYDGTGAVIGFRSLLKKGVIFDLNRFMYMSYMPTHSNPNGNGDYSRIFKFVDSKQEFIINTLELSSRLAKGRQMFLQQSDNQAYSEEIIKNILEQIVQNVAVFIPNGYEIQFNSLDTSALQHFQSLLRYFDAQIAIGILGTSLGVNESQGSGTYAQAKIHQENSTIFQDYIKSILIDCIDEQYAYDLIKLNFDLTKYPVEIHPKAVLSDDLSLNLQEKIEKYESLFKMKIINENDIDFLRNEFELPKR